MIPADNLSAKLASVAVLALALGACVVGEEKSSSRAMADPSAVAQLLGANQEDFGTATLTRSANGLMLELQAKNLSAGTHGIHLHMTGKCEGPDFASAGGHWNPDNRKHGLDSPAGSHAGDMPNIASTGTPVTNYSYDLKGAALTDGTRPVLDQDGTAIIIHADPDDNNTDPSGNSGGRIICGVFKAV